MNVSSAVLQLATQLTSRATRQSAADALAALFRGSSLLVFVRDEEVNELLTAPGFPQTLPNRRQWRAFLEECVEKGQNAGHVSLHGTDTVPAVGVANNDAVVLVVVGSLDVNNELEEFRALMPLVAAAFCGEQQASIAAAQAQLASESARHAEQLVDALNSAHTQLQHTAARLRTQKEELENQAVELEIQTEALLEVNEELRVARAAADRANRAKSEFLSTMSHELRTPLNAISGYVQLLQIGIHGQLNSAQLGALDRVTRSQAHLLRLINDILSLARIEAGGMDYQLSDILLSQAVGEIIPMIEPQLDAKNLQMTIDVPDEPIHVRADAEKLDQILLNLLSNAVKFTSDGGVTISAGRSHESSTAFISVADTGPGIPLEMLQRIFEPFVQVESGTRRSHEGTGLGLAISRDLAEGMGGALSARSKPGEGSVFIVTLPLALTAHESETEILLTR